MKNYNYIGDITLNHEDQIKKLQELNYLLINKLEEAIILMQHASLNLKFKNAQSCFIIKELDSFVSETKPRKFDFWEFM